MSQATFREFLRSEMVAAGLTASELGRRADVNISLIGHYLNGRREPTLAQIRKLAAILPRLAIWIGTPHVA